MKKNVIISLADSNYFELLNELIDSIKRFEESKNIAERNGILLPLDPWKEINSIIEKTSQNKCSMLQDLENGQKTEIDAINGMLHRIKEEMNQSIKYIILTGGFSTALSEHINHPHTIDTSLTLKGIKLIWEENNE